MESYKGYKGFRVEERFFIKESWEVKLIWNRKKDDKHLALFHDKPALDLFVEALEQKGIKNLTGVNPFNRNEGNKKKREWSGERAEKKIPNVAKEENKE